MLIYLADMLVETNNINFIRASPKGITIMLKDGNTLTQTNPTAAEAFRFAMEVGSSLGIVNVEALYADRDVIREGRAQTKDMALRLRSAQQAQQAVDEYRTQSAINVGLDGQQVPDMSQPRPVPPPPPIGGGSAPATKRGAILTMPGPKTEKKHDSH